MHARRLAVLFLYFFIVLLSISIAKGYSTDKRVKQGTSFKTMVRYGRANTRNSNNNNIKDGKIVNVYPRADAFFLGTRYGKRSSWSPNASLVYPVTAPLCGGNEDLSCTYTGVLNLYRCNARQDATNDDA